MSKKSIQQELQPETPAINTADQLELIDDMPDVVRTDLRKFNRTRQLIAGAVKTVTSIVKIESEEQATAMTQALKQLSIVEKTVDNKRKELGDPYRLEVVRINDYAKELVKDVPGAIRYGKDLTLAFYTEQKIKARHEQLVAAGLEWHPKGLETNARKMLVPAYFDPKTDMLVYRIDVEAATDESWKMILFNIETKRAEKQVEDLRLLEEEKAGADFFGDDEAVAEVDKKIAQAAAPSAPVFVPTAAPKPSGLTKRWTHQLTDLSQVPREYLQLDEKKVKEAIAAGTRTIPGLRIYQDESITLR